jgi:hypothetical protein
MQYINQSYQDLHLTLVEDVSLDDFTLLESKTIKHYALDIDLHIIGESHIIRYKINDMEFYEIFACKTINNNNVIFSKNIQELSHFKLQNLNYQFDVKIYTEEKEILDFDEVIEFIFPKGSRTAIWLTKNKKNIKIVTLHSYLNEGKYIYTESKIDDI